jgi:hypothetical protein
VCVPELRHLVAEGRLTAEFLGEFPVQCRGPRLVFLDSTARKRPEGGAVRVMLFDDEHLFATGRQCFRALSDPWLA